MKVGPRTANGVAITAPYNKVSGQTLQIIFTVLPLTLSPSGCEDIFRLLPWPFFVPDVWVLDFWNAQVGSLLWKGLNSFGVLVGAVAVVG